MAEGSSLYVQVRGLERSFGGAGNRTLAIRGASFDIFAGDCIALVGPSGSGKSSLLNIICGLDRPDSGSVSWPGLAMRSRRAIGQGSRDIAMAYQSPSLIPFLNVLENVTLPLLLDGMAAVGADPLGMEALSRFGVDELAGKLPEQVSGGQAQRIVLARTVVAKPMLLIADEPTGQLDQINAVAAIEALLDWCRNAHCALVVATHDPEVSRHLDTVWTIDHGVLATQVKALAMPLGSVA